MTYNDWLNSMLKWLEDNPNTKLTFGRFWEPTKDCGCPLTEYAISIGVCSRKRIQMDYDTPDFDTGAYVMEAVAHFHGLNDADVDIFINGYDSSIDAPFDDHTLYTDHTLHTLATKTLYKMKEGTDKDGYNG